MRLKQMSYLLGNIQLDYWLDEDTQHIFLTLLPRGIAAQYAERRLKLQTSELVSSGIACDGWHAGALCHISVQGDVQSNGAGGTLKHGQSTWELCFETQDVCNLPPESPGLEIKTTLHAPRGDTVIHTVKWYEADDAIRVDTAFHNNAEKPITLDLLTSFSLDCLSPMQTDDAPGALVLHRFYGGWSLEGRSRSDSVEELNLDCTWFPAFPESERYGSLGSFPVGRWFPFGAIEDKEHKLFWAAQLGHNASWQMELSHDCDCYSLSGGLADREFGAWSKTLAPGECLAAPTAYLSVCQGSLEQVCQNITALFTPALSAQPKSEQSMPCIYNDWCTTWGHPTADLLLCTAQRLVGTPIKYIVADAGWTVTNNDHLGQGGNGDWICNEQAFPGGMLPLSQKLRTMGFALGIWYEFEVTTQGARVHEHDYDKMHVQRNGHVVVSGKDRSFWDFRNPEVVRFLNSRVTEYLRDNEIGYLKVDYNGNIGSGCDGAESLGEGLRLQMEAVRSFFISLRSALPELVIENCAAGGHRLEPSMIQLTAMSNFSDAHECREIPVIAANLHNLVLPRQSQVWAALSSDMTLREIGYRLSSCFLGRMCLSGDIAALPETHWTLVQQAFTFYEQAKAIIAQGFTRRFGSWGENAHHPSGTQAVLRIGTGAGALEALLVCHAFASPLPQLLVSLPQGNWRITASFGESAHVACEGSVIKVNCMPENSAFALLLQQI